MRIELADGETLELGEREAEELYEVLLEQARQFGASSAAGKLRRALTWSSGHETRVALTRGETAAVLAARNDDRLAHRPWPATPPRPLTTEGTPLNDPS
jgi:hypothetical protein